MKFVLLNIRSLSNKTYINYFISQLGLHVLFLTKCWLSSTASAAFPPAYSFLFSLRQGKKGGGIASMFSNLFTCKECTFRNLTPFEYLVIIIRSQHVLLLTINRPPKQNPNFLSDFSELVSTALVEYDKVILRGDFNLHANKSSDSKAMELTTSFDWT